jgi:O-antigen/teichoic acid export membrane protein
MTVSTLSNPILVTGDRFLIGAALPMAAVAQYVAVGEVASKLGLVAAVLQPVLFPALAATLAADAGQAARLFDRGVRATVLALAPAALVVVAFAPEGLRLWLGPEMARDAAPVLQLLAIAAYVNTCAQMPFSALQSAGRSDIPAKFHTLEVPIYLATLWFLVGRIGLVGAAIAWLLRMLVDTLALYAALPLAMPGDREALRPVVRRAVGLTLGGAAALAACALAGPLAVRATIVAGAAVAFGTAAPRWLLTRAERVTLTRAWRARTRPRAAAATSDAPVAGQA